MDRLRSWVRGVVTPWDAALAVALAAIACFGSIGSDVPQGETRALLSGLGSLGLLLRVSHPVLTAAWLASFLAVESVVTESPDEIGFLLAIIVGAYSVWAHAPAGRAWIGSLALALAVSLSVALDPSDTLSNVAPTVLLFIGVPGGIGWGVYRRSTAIAALELETAALTEEAETAAEDERRRIARELHDVVSHAVTLIAVQAEAGQAVLDRDPAAARRSLEAIGSASRDALGELHRMLGLLSDGVDDGDDPADGSDRHAGLARVPALVAGARAAGMDVEVSVRGTPRSVGTGAEHCAFRVVQEGVTNALRHAPGSTVTIDVAYAEDALEVSVVSVGRRHSSAYGGTGRGLSGLRERITALGGSLQVAPSETSFALRARMPAATRAAAT